MLWVPQKGIKRYQDNTGSVGAAQIGTAVTTGASSATKGTPAEIFSSTNFDAYEMQILVSSNGESTVASDCALDILIGSATEEVLIPNLLCGGAQGSSAGNNPIPRQWNFPLYVPAGSRIAVQAASLRTSFAFRVAIYLIGGDGIPPHRVGTKVTTYGIGTVPNGTAITPGASGAQGSWTQITASTTEDHFAIIPSFQVTNDTAQLQRQYRLELGVGAATEEAIGFPYWFTVSSAETMVGPFPSDPIYQDIPSGTRLVGRASDNSTNDAAYDVAFHCVS